ncbi:YqiA/YcfP family alpha/beta fold hydrolase [Thalassotalea mangrovi]|uniref:Esterase YqiA n=1 Tax=Thalassotalea mangrovi TaxID=2572245 RepID=A0A4V5NUP2_9GAMM|nr:YqiA/YcfP family alpha/beta fold hydrolase [Thalassotalea mangrovi]TKB47201.1 esterase YqiA [Thalassotalea mangrovi]
MNNPQVLFIHGFNSSPRSLKAEKAREYFQQNFANIEFHCPQLESTPDAAMQQLLAIVDSRPGSEWLFIGSSLGGYFATYLAEQLNAKAVLVNPAVRPFELLQGVLGEHTNPYTAETYLVTSAHLQSLREYFVSINHPENFLVMVQTGDEVLDYRQAVEKYQQCQMIVQQGGDHSFVGFANMLDNIVNFFQLQTCNPNNNNSINSTARLSR